MSRQESQDPGSKVLLLKNKIQECVMSMGKVMADQVCASAALEHERMKLQIISAKTNVLDRSRRDAVTQTEDGDELDRERRRLLEQRAQLLEDIKGMPNNSQSMVDILKKRNAALLIREERALHRARKLRQEKQDRLDELRGLRGSWTTRS